MLRRVLILSLLATPALAAHLAGSPSQAATTTESCSLPERVLTRADLPAGVDVVACAAVGRRLSLGRDIGVEVPRPGEGVTVSVLGVDHESSFVISVDVSKDGDISYLGSGAAQPLGATTTDPSPTACADTGYGQLGYKWYGPVNWYLNNTKRPDNLTHSETVTAITDGGLNVANAFNDCGELDDVDASISYKGTTSAAVDMFHSDGIMYCDVSTATNKLSTVSFQWMPSGYLGATCTWRVNRDPEVPEAIESDMRLNASKAWTITPGWSGCDQQYDLEYVATHERGHTFGLADVSGDHTGLTMYARGSACSKAGRTLALGDILGLRLYY